MYEQETVSHSAQVKYHSKPANPDSAISSEVCNSMFYYRASK